MKKQKNTSRISYPGLILLLLLTACATLFITKPVHAALNREKVDNGMRIYGTATVDYFDDEIEKIIGITNDIAKNYSISLSVTFPSAKDRPDYLTYAIDDQTFTVYTESSNTLKDTRTVNKLHLDSTSVLTLTFPFDMDYDDECEVLIDFTIKELPGIPKVSIVSNSLPALYPGDTDILTLSIKDPYRSEYDTIRPEEVSVKFSDSTIAKVSKKDFSDNSRLYIYVKVSKAGSTKFSATYKGVTVKRTITVHKTTFYIPSSATMTLKQKKHINTYISQIGAGSCTVKNLKSSNKKVLSVSGKYLIAKKAGKAKVTFTLNGARKTINFKVSKPAPTLKQLKVKLSGYTYYPTSGQTYFYVTLRNTSQWTVTKVKMRYYMTLNERMSRTQTHTVNLKPGASKKIKVNIGKCFINPEDRVAKCLKFWYK